MLGTRVLHRFRPALLLVLVVGFVVALQVTPAFAATITVTNLADPNPPVVDGNCTLREAVQAANTNTAVDACAAGTPGADTIQFSVTGTITLHRQLAVLDSPLTIEAATGGTVFVRGATSGTSRRVFLVGNELAIDTISRDLTLRNIGVINGVGSGLVGGTGSLDGGCIYVATNSIVRLDGSVVSNCSTGGTGVGGGIFAASGAAASVGTQVILTNSATVRNNTAITGGGIYMTTGEVQVINNACVRNNSSGGSGGGIYMAKDSHLRIGSPGLGFIVGNTAGGGGGGGVFLEAINGFSGDGARFYANSLGFGNLGSAWLALGGDTGVHPNAGGGRFCTNCCIVGNSTVYAVYQDENVLGTDWRNNWWGSNWGPLIFDLDPTQSNPPEIGSAVSNGDGIRGVGVITPGSAVEVGLTSSGTWDTAPLGAWLYSSSAPITGVTPPVPNTAPADCLNIFCTGVSSQGRARTCNNPTTCGLSW